jgi:hypothetical protein
MNYEESREGGARCRCRDEKRKLFWTRIQHLITVTILASVASVPVFFGHQREADYAQPLRRTIITCLLTSHLGEKTYCYPKHTSLYRNQA